MLMAQTIYSEWILIGTKLTSWFMVCTLKCLVCQQPLKTFFDWILVGTMFTSWFMVCSLKGAFLFVNRTKEDEKYDVEVFRRRGQCQQKKLNVLSSLQEPEYMLSFASILLI